MTKNGETLLGALNFFTSSINTLCNKTIEDTLQSIRQYEAARIEYDAYRTDLEGLSTKPDANLGVNEAQQNYELHRQHFMKLRAEVAIKMKFLDENRVSALQFKTFCFCSVPKLFKRDLQCLFVIVFSLLTLVCMYKR